MPHSTTSNSDTWRTALTNAYKHRVDPDSLRSALTQLSKKSQPPTRTIVETLLSTKPGQEHEQDPLIARYVELSLQERWISPATVLLGLLHRSGFSKNGDNSAIPVSSSCLPTFEEKVFTMLRPHLTDESCFVSHTNLHGIVLGLAKWLHTISNLEIARQVELGPVHSTSLSTASMYESLGALTYTFFSHKNFNSVERCSWWKGKRAVIVAELEKYDLTVLQFSRSQLSGYLRNLTTRRPFLEVSAKGTPELTRDQILSTFQVLPTVNTRAGLYIWLSACLHSRPLTDDATMRNHLLVRYGDDPQNAAMGLILASFDVLGRQMQSETPGREQRLIKSFVCNKLPLLLSSFSTLLSTQGLESCISMSMLSLHTESLSQTGAKSTAISQIRADFLRACMLHGIITESTIATILPEHAVSAPKIARYTRASLVTQCSSNIAKLDNLLVELDQMGGNAGAIAGCVVDMIAALCSSKDIMTLKTLCTKLLKRLPLMDLVLQYTSPVGPMVPLCQLLNDWTHDQDQTEFQPPYEDFACIFLFTISVIRRYDLSRIDLGITDDESFLAKIMTSKEASISMNNLTEKQSSQLSHWIQGLYATDDNGEIVGISDEVYSTCPPQSFYILVPTIFEQTVIACKAKALTPAIMKAGLEFLLEPFLLPSLVSGLLWAARSTWKDTEDTNVRLQIMEKLLKPVSTSQDVQTMHRAAVTTVAQQVERSLQHLLRVTSQKKKEISALLLVLKPYIDQTDALEISSAEQQPTGARLDIQLKKCVQDLTTWTTESTISAPPRVDSTLIRRCCRVLGPGPTADILLQEVVQHLGSRSAPSVLDVCAALAGTPDPQSYAPVSATLLSSSPNPINTLQGCLRMAASDVQTLLRMQPKKAEALIRLQKIVEAQNAVSSLASQLDMVNMAMPAQASTDQVMLGLSNSDGSLDAAAAVVLAQSDNADFDRALNIADASTQELGNVVDNSSLLLGDQSQDIFGDLGMNLSGDSAQLATFSTDMHAGDHAAIGNPDDDIFGDLDMAGLGGDFDFS